MRKLYIFSLIALACVIIGLAFADQITLSTYYPAPYGVYNEMRVMKDLGVGTTNPQSTLDVNGGVRVGQVDADGSGVGECDATGCTANNAGTMRYCNNKIEYCDGTGWKAIGGASQVQVTEKVTVPRYLGPGFQCGSGLGCQPGDSIFDLGSHTFCALGGTIGPGGFNTSCLVYFESATNTWKLSIFDTDNEGETHNCFPICIDIDGSNVTYTSF